MVVRGHLKNLLVDNFIFSSFIKSNQRRTFAEEFLGVSLTLLSKNIPEKLPCTHQHGDSVSKKPCTITLSFREFHRKQAARLHERRPKSAPASGEVAAQVVADDGVKVISPGAH